MSTHLRIGTRGSPLALWQANFIADSLRNAAPECAVQLIEIQTVGDQVRDVPLSQIGGEGVFTKAIQQALLDNTVDVAVHSLKDLPTIPVPGLLLAAVPARGPVGDAFVSKRHATLASLPRAAVVATSSLRRRAQILHHRPDLTLVDIRGNVDTRLRKLTEQNLDAIILAEAGLRRLGLEAEIREILDRRWMYPAVGQGALGLECRHDDAETIALLRKLDDPGTHAAVLAERMLLHSLGGGCQVPIGTVTEVAGVRLLLRGAVLPPDGSRRIEDEMSGSVHQPARLGQELAHRLMQKGAGELLAP